MRRALGAVVVGSVMLGLLPAPARAAAPCPTSRWVAAWAGVPSDASAGPDLADTFDASVNVKLPVNASTIRAVLTPSTGGRSVRVHLSNRFGTRPVTFARTTIARRGAGASLVGTATPVAFGGRSSITVPAGADVVSDAVAFHFAAFDDLAVSTYVPDDAGKPTEHQTARQTSYLTTPSAGDHTADRTADAFVQRTTARPFVTGLDVRAGGRVGTVVALGDSLTDGYQGEPGGVPEVAATVDANGRWPDVLGRRLRAARLPFTVANAGISGNRVLRDGATDTFGPSALNRVQADVLDQAGVSTVVLLEGINDIGQAPDVQAPELIAGYRTLIAKLHARGLRVIQGTLTPSGGAAGAYGTPAADAVRQTVNAWIRNRSPADRVVDVDAVVRDRADRSRIRAAYDGGDHLHFNLAGYKAIGGAVPLSALRGPACRRTLHVRVTPRRSQAGRPTTLRVRPAGAGVSRVRISVADVRAPNGRIRVRR